MAYKESLRVEIQEVIRRWLPPARQRQIAEGTGLSRARVRKYPCWMSRVFAAFWSWPVYSAFGTQGVPRRATAFSMSNNLRITATKATLPGFPR